MILLIPLHAGIHARRNTGKTPMHYASYNRCIKPVHYLFLLGADCYAKDKDGNLPMHYACLKDHVSVVHYFISQHSKEKEFCNNNLETLWHIVCANGFGSISVVQYLIETQKVEIEAKDVNDETP